MCTEEEKGKKSVYWLTVPVVVEFRGEKSGKKSTYHCQTKYFSTLEGIKRLQRCKTSQNDHSIYAGRLRRSFGNVNNFKISPPSAEIFAYENSLTALWTKTGTLMNYMTFSLLPIHVHFQLLNDRGQSSSVRMQDSSHETRHDKDFLFYFILHQKAGISFPSLTENHRYVIHINHCIFLHKKSPAWDFN